VEGDQETSTTRDITRNLGKLHPSENEPEEEDVLKFKKSSTA
jgi:hypothetical protein